MNVTTFLIFDLSLWNRKAISACSKPQWLCNIFIPHLKRVELRPGPFRSRKQRTFCLFTHTNRKWRHCIHLHLHLDNFPNTVADRGHHAIFSAPPSRWRGRRDAEAQRAESIRFCYTRWPGKVTKRQQQQTGDSRRR